MYEIKTEDGCEDFSKDKELSYFSNYSAKSKYNSNALVNGKVKDEAGVLPIREFVDFALGLISRKRFLLALLHSVSYFFFRYQSPFSSL